MVKKELDKLEKADRGAVKAEEPVAADKLAGELDQFMYDYDTYGYKDSFDTREDGRNNVKALLYAGETGHILKRSLTAMIIRTLLMQRS